jgi:hypothetical protein
MDKEEQLKLAREKSKTTNLGNTNSSKKNRLLKNTLNRIVTQDDEIVLSCFSIDK